jgi:hypothetical protein
MKSNAYTNSKELNGVSIYGRGTILEIRRDLQPGVVNKGWRDLRPRK